MDFYKKIRNRLGARKEGFDFIFNYLQSIQNPFIVETGCARLEDTYEAEGQSSILFDAFINEHGGDFYTVDISLVSVWYSRSKLSKKSQVFLDDSVAFLKELNQSLEEKKKKIDFLYLDSFDAPQDQPKIVKRSAEHHLNELLAITPSLKKGALIGVDDNWFENGVCIGKGQKIFEYLMQRNIFPVYQGHQLLWIYS